MRAWIPWLCCVAALVGMQVVGATPRQNKRATQSASGAAATAAKSPRESKTPPAVNAETAAAKLPVRRVVLYKGGVGYFEHLGEVRGDQNMRIDFTSSQLNDVLQSLTVLDLNGGRITGIDYDSEAPFSQRLSALGLPLGANTDLSKFLAALRGTRLEIRNGNTEITGRLLSVERKTRVSGGTTLEVDLATIVSDSGEVRTVEVTPTVSVRVADPDVNREVERYLTLLASTHQQDLRRMTISAAGSGARQLYVSYISEVPIWKTTYRIVLPSKTDAKPLLQGWAIVDNTTGEDWDNVELSLAAGAPQSFIQQLSQPYYARRPVVPLPETAELTPQTHESAMLGGSGSLSGVVTDPQGTVIPNAQVQIVNTATGVANSTTTDDEGNYEFDDLPAGNYRLEFHMNGFQTSVIQGVAIGEGGEQTQDAKLQVGGSAETVEVTAAAVPAPAPGVVGSGRELGNGRGVGAGRGYGSAGGTLGGIVGGVPSDKALAMLRNQASAGAEGSNLGDLFEYKLKDHVTIRKNESALVPIVQVHIAAEKVSLWNNSLGSQRPLRALWLTNSSALTLDGGSFTVLEDEAFAGEGLTDPIKPGEKRLVSYAADLGVRVDAKSESRPQRVTRVRIWRGVMSMTREMQQSTTYTVRDDDTTPRTVLIEHPLRVGWKLAEATPKPEETTSNVYRFRVSVKPKETSKLEVGESEPLDTRYEISNVTDDQITLFLNQKSISAEVEAALRKIVEQKNRVAALDAEISSRNNEKQKIYDDQQRIRENLKALKGSPEERALTQRYTQQLADQETRLETLQKETQDFQTKRDQAQGVLDNMIQSLSLDVTL
ncbi:MAG TPA: carboxypeptidase regulatory-like domain-containing protein [Candidatus Acidoferrales bacterium]|nr:carboxypeptidase regulatory-like domain-containing protein [Candidatus Acidoferrales bacterium]